MGILKKDPEPKPLPAEDVQDQDAKAPVEVNVRQAPPRTTAIQVPPSYDRGMLQLWAEIIHDFREKNGWRYDLAGDNEDRMVKLFEFYYREICSWAPTRELALKLWEDALIRKKKDPNGYLEWIHIVAQNEQAQRGLLHHERMIVDWGIDAEKLRERFGIVRKEGDEISRAPDLIDVAAMMQHDVEMDYDVLAVVGMQKDDLHGGVGGGKSDFAMILASLLDPNFGVRTHVVYRNDVVRMERLQNSATEEMAWVVDEGEWWYWKQDWASKEVKEKMKDWLSRRQLHQKVIVVIPWVYYLAENLLNRVTWYFRILERGVVEVYRGNRHDDEMKKEDRFGTQFVTTIRVNRMPAPTRAVYERCKQFANGARPGALDAVLRDNANWPLPKTSLTTSGPPLAQSEPAPVIPGSAVGPSTTDPVDPPK